MTEHHANDEPAVVGVPPETPDQLRPSATGLVAGPVEGETDVQVADVKASTGRPGWTSGADLDQLLEDAEAGVEASMLDAPDDDRSI